MAEQTTVAELISQLQELPPDALVFCWDGADYCPEVEPATVNPAYAYTPARETSGKAVEVQVPGHYVVGGGYIAWHLIAPEAQKAITDG